jgi:leucyl aminopeptidase (aminopeptidase T)
MLDKQKLFHDVFAPTAEDTVLVLTDAPHDAIADHPDWVDRRQMAAEWHAAFNDLPVRLHPLLTYPATGANNGDLPITGTADGETINLEEAISTSTLVIALTEYSATAPLSKLTRRFPGLRVASMPGVLRRMEQTALAADYPEIARRTHLLADLLTHAEKAEIEFSTGHHLTLDLRFRTGHADDGLCNPDKQPFRLINLPSGEAFIVPYEGENDAIPSLTAGFIPMQSRGESFVLLVENNHIMDVEGSGLEANAFRAFLEADPARANVAELGLGCNDKAVVQGAVIEDEKAGLHWAYGRSEHLGGVVGPDAFKTPENVIHQDIVYAPDSQIGIKLLTLTLDDGSRREVIRDNAYLVF